MGLFDFLNTREGDFAPLRDNDTPYGPGPLILMYAIPKNMYDDELYDMIEDGMPTTKGVVMRRLDDVLLHEDSARVNDDDSLLDRSVEDALHLIMADGNKMRQSGDLNTHIAVRNTESDPCPVLYFSGVNNKEMMDTYRIIANEVYKETNGVHWPACAKVVEPAMQKSMRQVLIEISGDHTDAMRARKDVAEK